MRPKADGKRKKKRRSFEIFLNISVIIPAKNEATTISSVVREAVNVSPHTEVIVVCNGTTDDTEYLARMEGAKIISIDIPVGHDVGRAIGAQYASGDILLFVDADFVIPADILREYCLEVQNGFDVVLNSYSGYRTSKIMNCTSQAKRLLNKFLDRPDLLGSSMTTVPHALSRKAVEVIGYEDLIIPPKAQAKAILSGLTVTRAHLINTSKVNKRRIGRKENVRNLVLGDHVEAIEFLIKANGERGGFTDFNRKRDLLHSYLKNEPIHWELYLPTPATKHVQSHYEEMLKQNARHLSIIILAYNEESTIGDVICNSKELNPKEIIVVENGSTEKTLDICLAHGVKCITFPHRIGHDIGRAIGAKEATGDVLLFLDGDIIFEAEELWPFVLECYEGTDIALNDINPFYSKSSMIDYVSMAKNFLNRALKMSKLGYSSLTAVPHAMKKSAAEIIGYDYLSIPPKAQAMAVLKGLTISNTAAINVIERNKGKRSTNSTNFIDQMILGDHIEALHWVQKISGSRAFLSDNSRLREIVEKGSQLYYEDRTCIRADRI